MPPAVKAKARKCPSSLRCTGCSFSRNEALTLRPLKVNSSTDGCKYLSLPSVSAHLLAAAAAGAAVWESRESPERMTASR